MSRRVRVVAVVLLALCVAEVADAQPWRGRRRKPGAGSDLAPTVAIQTPTAQPTFITTATTINLEGIAGDDRGLANIRWTNQTTAATGNATGTFAWAVTASAGTATTAQDQFGSATNENAIDHVPNIGMAWTEALDQVTDDTCQVLSAHGSVGPSTNRQGELLACLLEPSDAISGADYTWSGRKADTAAAASNYTSGLVFAYQDAQNFCSVVWWGNANSVDMRLFRRETDVVTQIGSSSVDVPANGVVTVDVDGSAITVLVDGVTRIGPVTSAFCGTVGDVGVTFGPPSATFSTHWQRDTVRIDDVELVDRGASTSGIALNVGANVIEVCATDQATPTPHETCDLITVTRAASDTTLPVLSILDPSSGATTVAVETISGTSSDNIAVAVVTPSCPNCANVAAVSGTTEWSFMVTLTCDGVTQNVISVTATDAALNVSAADTITRTCTTADMTNPTVVITSPTSSATYTAPSAALNIGGTAADTGGSGLTQVVWSSDRGGSGVASGTTSWTIPNLTLSTGDTVFTVRSQDGAGNLSTPDTLTVTLASALSVTTTSLPPGVNGQAYAFCLAASGGTGPYTWTLQSGTLPAWASLTLDTTTCGTTNRYKVHGTPNAVATTSNLVFRVTDSAGMPDTDDTAALSITITAAGTGADSYYSTTLLGRGDIWKNYDLRSQATINLYSQISPNAQVTYCTPQPTCDTDPHRQNAAKIVTPFWTAGLTTITSAMTAALDYWDCLTPPVANISCIRLASLSNPSQYSPGRWLKIENEIVEVVDPDGNGPLLTRVNDGMGNNGFHIRRAIDGTTAASHSAGSSFQRNTNSVLNQVPLPLGPTDSTGTPDGYTYFMTFDWLRTDSYLGHGIGGEKTWQFMCFIKTVTGSKICLEPQNVSPEGSTTASICSAYGTPTASINPSTDVGFFQVRHYHPGTTNADWTLTNGLALGPNTFRLSGGSVACPYLRNYVFKANVRYRFFFRVQQRALNYDLVDLWIASETEDAVKVFENLEWSFDLNPNAQGNYGLHEFRIVYLNTSDETPAPNRIVNKQDYVNYTWWFVALRQAGVVGDTTLTDAALASSGLLARPQ
jgi:hypothetical protein